MKNSTPWVFLAFLGGAALGVLGASMLTSSSDGRPRPVAEELEALDEPPGSSAHQQEPLREATPLEPAAPRIAAEARSADDDGADEPLVTAALRAYARRELERAYREATGRAMPPERLAELLAAYEKIVLTTPAVWGRNEGEADVEDANEIAESGEGKKAPPPFDPAEGIAWLDGFGPRDAAGESLPSDGQRFAQLFLARSSGRAHDGPSVTSETPLADGAVLSYPAGVFRVRDLAQGRDPFPADVTLRGAGMEATLLVMDELRPRGALERFAIEDCTVFAEGGITDVRGEKALLALRRVRLVGFDCGAGGSVAINLDGCALSAVQCRFEGGYGRAPTGYANLIRSSPPMLARFEGCVLERVSLGRPVGKSVVLVGCRLVDLLEEPFPPPTLVDCVVSVLPEEQQNDEAIRKRDLGEFFPGWRERISGR